MTLSRPDLESQAAKVLDQLLGYMHRQEWNDRDRKFIADLLAEWDEQVTSLLTERVLLQRNVAELRELTRVYEWRLAGKGFMHYLRFLIGIDPWPSR